MRSMISLKNYEINSEEDIPAEYRAEIEEKLSNEPEELPLVASELTPGKRGLVVSTNEDIGKEFNEQSVFYLGHGTPVDESLLTSILETGLDVGRHGLYFTAEELGSGTDQFFEKIKGKLDNWRHKSSKNIVIVAVPKDYILSKNVSPLQDHYKPFYVYNEEKQRFSLRPEFIKGIYNAETQSFTENVNFYQNLDEETQKKLFEDIKKSYIQCYAKVSDVNPRETMKPLPLNEQEMETLCKEWYKEQLRKLRADRILDEEDIYSELHDMTCDMRKSEFEDTTHFVKDSIRDNREDELDKDDDGWEVDRDDYWD